MKAVKFRPVADEAGASATAAAPEVIELPAEPASADPVQAPGSEPAPPDPFNEEGGADPTLLEDTPTAGKAAAERLRSGSS
ncbi:hypothetical protein [Methylobrevis pamukkalensis]|uniref:Uncharacterized protein n=1 Tax=Methylobrevis pamukkalensis TaxID=1439726 RepID=A0A1E3H1D4_9HYPH|nr:hypothetical protein [Methylobrevis pamukkalensis]ODN70117.1 hypothetical protein A6302_02596 [Methylobrevis pamukkalensis]